MRTAVWLMVLAAAAPAYGQQAFAEEPADTCVECHREMEGDLARPVQLFADDIHKQNGFSCADCHGGDPSSYDPEESMSVNKGFRGKLGRAQVPELCGSCHGDPSVMHEFKPQQRVDQLVQYRTSVHGQRLAKGDLNVANCVDCHSVHDIREVRHALSPVHPLRVARTCARCHADAQHMEGYPIPADQLEHYERSVHWEALDARGDLSAPSCATCHGNHGAAPPGVGAVAQVCGSCHVVFQNAFEESPHKPVFEAMELAACIVCHGNHEILAPAPGMLGVGEGASCVQCHSEGEQAYTVARLMKERIDELTTELAESKHVLDVAEQAGMEVSAGRIQWTSANQELIKARGQVHSFQSERVSEPIEQGLQLAVLGRRIGTEALEEKEFRRRGLALSMLTILITMAGLWMAVRALESRGNSPGSDAAGGG